VLNVVVLIGNLATEPDLRYTPSGVPVCNFRLAVDRPFTNRDGETETDFVTIVTWRKLAETCGNYLDKGRLVGVQGRLQIRSWENQEGQRRFAAEVVADTVRFLGRRDSSSSAGQREESGLDDTFDYEGEDVPF